MNGEPITLNCNDIVKILPHRYPFLLVDKVIELDPKNKVITGQKNVTFNEPFFQGHFPGAPIMPGVLILEALAQLGGILACYPDQDRAGLLLSVNQAKFRNPVMPGDVLTLRCELIHQGSKGAKVKGKAMVGEKLAAEAEIGFVFAQKDQIFK